ncbi:subtilisin-like protease sbt3.3 [Phtheirospermum japonicum]|uniref:Subtilisin-like protease sbt3.3 n=1 Tax=Phtheirospermum japonicum TaxID=374723 RepID=A0A830BAZ4_9LAMI|nr:subtilisin-like protease sbt3.3 [Phtheirospermum japonicum]
MEMSIDRLSALPDGVLIHILSFLGVQKSAVTSVLSKRWRFIWAELPRLEFKNYSGESEKIREFVAMVNRTLLIRSGTHVGTFEVCSRYRSDSFDSDVDSWLDFAVKNKVKEVCLMLLSKAEDGLYGLPEAMYSNSSLTRFSVCGCFMNTLTKIEWQSLTWLYISESQLTQNLYELKVHDPDDEVNGPLLEISAPYVSTLDISFNAEGRKLVLRNTKSLVRADIDFSGFWDPSLIKELYEIILLHVKELELGLQFFKTLSELVLNGWQLPVSRLKCLTVNTFCDDEHNISGIFALLKVSPNLERLAIKGFRPEGRPWDETAPIDLDCDLLHLKTVKMSEFANIASGGEPMLTVARTLLKRATVLEEMAITLRLEEISDYIPIAQTLLTYPRSSGNAVYIVYLGERQQNDPKLVTDSHHDMLTSVMGSEQLAVESLVYSYKHGFSGFAAKLTESQAEQLSEHPDVVEVMPNSFYKPQTTRSWDYLGVSPETPNNLLNKSNMGDGVIIGVLDTGIWPESKSFRDEGLKPIPSGWKGICQSGDQFNASKHCNRKLIGARWFADGLLAEIGQPLNSTISEEFMSSRDAEGHGTHVSSTAAGAFVANVGYDGVGLGTARGGAPRARLAVYKVCWKVQDGMCASADILKGFDEGIKDGVHVLSLSIAITSLPLNSEVDGRAVIAIGSFHAVARGIIVVCAAGNDGPSSQTVKNIAPWIVTVGASTVDRSFPTQITLGNNKTFQGQSIYTGMGVGFTGLFYPGDDATSTGVCEDLSLRRSLVAGKVVLCFTTLARPYVTSNAYSSVRAAGGVGVIVSKNPSEFKVQCTNFPCAEVDHEVGTKILLYLRSTKNPTVKLSLPTTLVGKAVSAKIVEFSSRGPNSVAPSVLKPDIVAPGVNIIAATSGVDSSADRGFTMLSGTSMATPHVAGIVALLRALHPNWSPAAIRSALTTTAWTRDQYGIPIFAEGDPHKLADPFDYGGGIVNPDGASCPGLIYDMETADYINYLCSMEYKNSAISRLAGHPVTCPNKTISTLNVNLPSITIPHLRNSTTLTRRVTNVGPVNSVYRVIVEPPSGALVIVDPPIMIFNCNTKKIAFKVTVISMHQLSAGYYFGSLMWTDGVHNVRSPIAIRTSVP